MSFLARTVTPLLIALAAATPPLKAESLDVRIGYLQWLPDQGGPVLSNVIPEPEDAGLRGGAELAINDNSTTGKFLGQTYSLQSDVADSEEAAIAAFDAMRENGLDLFVVNAPASTLKALTEKAGDNTLIFNAGAEDDALRTGQCHVNLLHTIPSYSMLTDALGQWLNQRRWDEVFLITGPPTEADRNWANAFRRSARRFGSRLSRTSPGPLTLISAARPPKSYPPCSLRPEITTRWWWPMCGGAILASTCRSTPGCHARWWAPRACRRSPGTGWWRVGGGCPTTEPVPRTGQSRHEQRRLRRLGRHSRHWHCRVRPELSQCHRDPEFSVQRQVSVGGFQGPKSDLSGLEWPDASTHSDGSPPQRLVATAPPFEGFLHPNTELDTLGFDRPESECRSNG